MKAIYHEPSQFSTLKTEIRTHNYLPRPICNMFYSFDIVVMFIGRYNKVRI